MVFGSLRAQIQELQVHTPQASTVSTSLALGMIMTKEMLHAWMNNTIVLPKGELVTENEANMPMVSRLNGIRINMVVLPRETICFAGWSYYRNTIQGRSYAPSNERAVHQH